jgi:hypothetical protein
VNGAIWPLDQPHTALAFKTFPSPSERLRSHVALESMKDLDVPCLIVTRMPTHPGTRATIERKYPHRVQFVHWTGDDDAEEALEISLRILQESFNQDTQSP